MKIHTEHATVPQRAQLKMTFKVLAHRNRLLSRVRVELRVRRQPGEGIGNPPIVRALAKMRFDDADQDATHLALRMALGAIDHSPAANDSDMRATAARPRSRISPRYAAGERAD